MYTWRLGSGHGPVVIWETGLGVRRAEFPFPYSVILSKLTKSPWTSISSFNVSRTVIFTMLPSEWWLCRWNNIMVWMLSSPALQKLKLNNQRNRAATRGTDSIHIQNPFSLFQAHTYAAFPFCLLSLFSCDTSAHCFTSTSSAFAILILPLKPNNRNFTPVCRKKVSRLCACVCVCVSPADFS